jgi:superfamily II DNA helicase RecQ
MADSSMPDHNPDVSDMIPPIINAIQNVFKKSIKDFQEQMVNTFTLYVQGLSSQVLQCLVTIQNHQPSLPPPIFVHPNLLTILQPLLPYGQTPRFTCQQQAEAIQSCTSQFHVLVVMPTGSGKSLAFFGAPLLVPDKLFIVVTPLIALTDDMARRLAATRIEGGKWSPSINPFTAQLVLVSAHQAATTDFFLWAKTNIQRVHRIFIDEAHHVITSDNYRECFQLFDMITELGRPITFLTATLFERSIPRLCERMRINPSLLVEIRASTARPNVKISVTHCPNFKAMTHDIHTLVESIELGPNERGLIFCTTVTNCKIIASALGVDYYVARVKEQEDENTRERARLDAQWRDGIAPPHRWMVATLCFGQGIDFPGVRWVIHAEVRNLLTYTQEIGRAGRDGNPAHARLFYTRLPMLTDDPSTQDHEGVREMIDFLEFPQCRRLTIGRLDPIPASCAALSAQLCDHCEEATLVFFPAFF